MWYSICSYASLQVRAEYGFTLEKGWETKQGFVVLHAGQIYAYANTCPHQHVSLNWSPHTFFEPNHEFIQCSMHGAWFEPSTGLCIRGPCVRQFLESFPVRIEDDNVQVWLEFN
ncbi:Rieske (2Fe-2S) protein [uncultured Thiothrix sp.]|uniref:Rieske (2Fe-2S) protein n=1 Tax=uncultured Thiothrix sp. TaxID=223185 RepID=UPI00262E76C3|nr:Rieske (2Fe-2S) protein [uncultured Thiothrix sp.]HMT92884.1 Rieske (2Fe-2S) protein [Thiolinea sp.]